MQNRGPGLAEFVNELKLADDQKEKVKEIFAKEKEALDQWTKDNEKAFEALRTEMQNAPRGDQNAMRTLMEKRQKLMDTQKPIQDKTVLDLGNVLTFDQMQQVKEFLEIQAMGPQAMQLMATLKKCDLTADQKVRVMSMLKETNEKAQAARTAAMNNPPPANTAADNNANNRRGPGGGAGGQAFQVWRTLEEDIQNNVLTTEQKAKFAEQQRANRPQGGQGGGRGNRGGN